MPSELITSPANPLLKGIRKLRQRKHREERGAVFVEGIAAVWQALESGLEVETLLVAPELLTSERAAELVAAHEAAGMTVARVSAGAFAAVAERDNPAGLGAVVRPVKLSLDDLNVPPIGFAVAVVDAGNPGNVGTIVRTADAAGAAAVIVAGGGAEPWHPTAVKASMGTVFSTPVVGCSLEELIEWARSRGLPIVATSARGTVDHWGIDYATPCLLLFGSEATGLPPEALDAADVVVRIPQQGAASSLNLAVAAGIVIYELRRALRA